ncbi:MAG: hypothetical protein OEV94_00420 [Deltaproteobacteria bacterium]|nr:hypothetical protein [Deltaproteobacteria bacterium]
MTGNPSPETLRRCRLTWEQTQADWKQARGLSRGEPIQACFLAVQAAANALWVVCRLNGLLLVPLHDLGEMLNLAGESDPRFLALTDQVSSLREAVELDPFAPPGSPAAGPTETQAQPDLHALAGKCLVESAEVLEGVRGYLTDNKKRFFKP